mgnify:CR=1 FL=1
MNFASDNVHGAHPAILEALAAANSGPAAPYGNDTHTAAAERRLGEIFGREVKAFLVTTGTAANGLALSAICPGHGAILCHGESHIHSDECNGPAFFTGGALALREIADACSVVESLDRLAEHLHLAVDTVDETEHALHERRLARAVRAEQGNNFVRTDLESVDLRDRLSAVAEQRAAHRDQGVAERLAEIGRAHV